MDWTKTSKILEWLDSPEGQASLKEFAAEMNAKAEVREARSKKVSELSDSDFERLMNKIVDQHGEGWNKKCYDRGYEPHPTNLLHVMIDAAQEYGEDVSEEYEKLVSFPVEAYKLRDWVFFMMFGQGVHTRVYNPQNEAVIWL